jgi:hypothetical protein
VPQELEVKREQRPLGRAAGPSKFCEVRQCESRGC